MPDREKVIKGLECCVTMPGIYPHCEECPYADAEGTCANMNGLHRDALALLKAQEISIEKVAEDYGLTPDGVSFALSQYQTVISEITHGMLSKLSYNAKDVLQTAQERWCDTCELQKAQEPVKPKVIDTSSSKLYHSDMFKNYYCGNCGEFLHIVNRKDLFCSQCGQAVKWE